MLTEDGKKQFLQRLELARRENIPVPARTPSFDCGLKLAYFD